jgi:beta-mannosidase
VRGGPVLDGDVHFYNYEDDCEDAGIYPEARFVSEFGFQSHPSVPTYKAALPPPTTGTGGGWRSVGAEKEHLVNGSEFLSFRQRHPGGDAQMLRQLRRRFNILPYPRGEPEGRERGFDVGEGRGRGEGERVPSLLPFGDYVYLTQVQQARCYDVAIRKWRRGSSGGGGAGGAGAARGTMGVLYWQLNDVWAGPTW